MYMHSKYIRTYIHAHFVDLMPVLTIGYEIYQKL